MSGGPDPLRELLLSHRRGSTSPAYQLSDINICFDFVTGVHSTDLHLPPCPARSRQGLPVRLTVFAHVVIT